MAPTVGGQYFLSDNFSVGGEWSIVIMNTASEEGRGLQYHEFKEMTTNTVSRLTIRYYF